MDINYSIGIIPDAATVAALYNEAGLSRPTGDLPRIRKMYEHANLVITAWHHEKLTGISRSITDFCWCCYLADLAVAKDYQRMGIGKKLIELTRENAGPQSMVLLLSVDSAMDYYPQAGLTKVENGFILQRQH